MKTQHRVAHGLVDVVDCAGVLTVLGERGDAVVPVLATILVLLVLTLPRVASTAWDSLGNRWDALVGDWAHSHLAAAGTAAGKL
jgi:hypothetical protein